MLGRLALATLCASALAISQPVFAAPAAFPVDIAAGPLSSSLQTLERQTGIELLYDGTVIAKVQAPGVQGNLGAEEALRQLVSDASLTVRRAESGTWIIERPDTP